MSFKIGDRVKFDPEKGNENLLENEYIVLEYFVNIAKQETVRMRNIETKEEVYQDPNLLIIVENN
jgi:hypothetical protein